MKKLLLTLSLLLCAATSLFGAHQVIQGVAQQAQLQQHIPAAGLIQLSDTAAKPGIIMDIILNDINFQEERDTIRNFSQLIQNPNYQNIVMLINSSVATIPGALEVLEAFERAIMHYIHNKNYIVIAENKWLNIFITGIRWSWVNPIYWIQPQYWYSDHDPILQQCMQELSTLARITKKYSTISSARMKATVESYLHWRKNTLITIGTYLLANGILRRNFNKSPLGVLINGGLTNTPKVIGQIKNDVIDFTTTMKNYLTPVASFMLNGRKTSDQTTTANQVITNDKKTILTKENNITHQEKNNSPSLYSRLKNNVKKYNQNLYDKFLDKEKIKMEQPVIKKAITAPTVSSIPKEKKSFPTPLEIYNEIVRKEEIAKRKKQERKDKEFAKLYWPDNLSNF